VTALKENISDCIAMDKINGKDLEGDMPKNYSNGD
jgi:hypothetical protein